ncbi:hypothetical protein JDV02_004266 [Purpureocillium takamizusanense]|uniref:N-acetyltransferase domain-containing protein n=1 Tax=Purpureocillium takamizusanense TaxID=2060973 RepID=A0A9Q8QDF9_9HYPO|nr:uncharacterized protein JDV02_004266 [Purpureocillium takamizusanense]UNI17963.1 hypothetical protein JDV02_004266 [Purpureocillium takamizusanense]
MATALDTANPRYSNADAQMVQATITTPRLELRPLSPAHAELLVELNSDPAVTRYVHSGRPLTREEALADHAERLAAAEAVSGLGYWMGFDRATGEAVGWWALTPVLPSPSAAPGPSRTSDGGDGSTERRFEAEEPGSSSASRVAAALVGTTPAEGFRAELGYRLFQRHWRKGLAKEGGRALVRHGFTTGLYVREAYGETMAVNEASRATMAACGLGYRRTFHLSFQVGEGDEVIPGTEEGEVEYAVGRDEWLAWDDAMAIRDEGRM